MRSEVDVVEMIMDIAQYHDEDDENDYLDEGEQASLNALYAVLDRSLTKEEKKELRKRQKECI